MESSEGPSELETDLLLNVTKGRAKLSGRERAASRRVTVEPVVFLASASYIVASVLRVQYVLVRIQEQYNYTVHSGSNCEGRNQSENSTDRDIKAQIQADSARWLLDFIIVGVLPGFASAIILGSLSDKFGRKVILIVSTIGTIIFAGICTAVMALELPLEVFYAADISVGLTGGRTMILALSYSYIADVTTKEHRTSRIIVIETVFIIVGFLQIGIGYIKETVGFAPTAGLSTGLGVLALIYLICPHALIETIEGNKTKTQPMRDKLAQSMRGIVALVYGEGGVGRTCRLAIIYVTCFMLTPEESSVQLSILYLQATPFFCWTSVLIGYYLAAACALFTIGNIGGFKVLGRCFSHHWIFQISCWCTVAYFVVFGFVRTTLQVFLGMLLMVPGGLVFPIIRSSLSKMVRADEQGVAFSLFASVENLGMYISPIVCNAIYIASVSFYPSLVFFVVAGVTSTASILVGTLHVISKRNGVSILSASNDQHTYPE